MRIVLGDAGTGSKRNLLTSQGEGKGMEGEEMEGERRGGGGEGGRGSRGMGSRGVRWGEGEHGDVQHSHYLTSLSKFTLKTPALCICFILYNVRVYALT